MRCPHCNTTFLTLLHTNNFPIYTQTLFLSSANYEPVSARMVVMKAREHSVEEAKYRYDAESVCFGDRMEEAES